MSLHCLIHLTLLLHLVIYLWYLILIKIIILLPNILAPLLLLLLNMLFLFTWTLVTSLHIPMVCIFINSLMGLKLGSNDIVEICLDRNATHWFAITFSGARDHIKSKLFCLQWELSTSCMMYHITDYTTDIPFFFFKNINYLFKIL